VSATEIDAVAPDARVAVRYVLGGMVLLS
jgi:hypothetical protein